MIKAYILTLLVAFLAGAQMIQAQESMDDANESGGQPVAEAPVGNDPAPVANDEEPATQQAPLSTIKSDTLTVLFNKGVEQYKEGKYDEAIMLFDGMLLLEKYDTRAITYKKRAFERITSAELKKLYASRAQAFTDVDVAWNREPKNLIAMKEAEAELITGPDRLAIHQMEERLKSIAIPSLDFTDASIEDVVLFLVAATRHSNSASGDVDILLVGIDRAMGSGEGITISFSEMNLYEALQFVVEMASLKIEIKSNLVVIMPANYIPFSKLVLKSYDIVPEVGANLEASGDSGGGAGDLFGDSSSDEKDSGPVDVASFFSIIDFPEGASAIYQPRFHKLFVRNTPKNIKGVEAVLANLDEEAKKLHSQQVLIETKFVEFSEGALEELGFDWNMFGSGTVGSMEMDPRNSRSSAANQETVDPNTGQTIYVDQNDRPGQNLFGESQRDNTGAFAKVKSGVLSSMGGTPASMLFNNGDIDLQITAMEQEGTADVLSSPRITTKSGTEAVIRVAETHRYPQSYGAETGQRTSPIVTPEDWEDVDLGVSLTVKPTVDNARNTINLDLLPEIIKLKGTDPYRVGYNAFDGGGDIVAGPGGTGEALEIEMPYFERRSVKTKVVVADGRTVVMGGMIDERTETFRDQIPFLGDIPYLGRLFRTEGSRTAKKNLTIFVTATLVDAHGTTQAQRELARQ